MPGCVLSTFSLKKINYARGVKKLFHLLGIVGGGLPSAKEADDCNERDEEYRTNGRADADVENRSRSNGVID